MSHFDLAGLTREKDELEGQMGEEGFWDDVENANKVNQRIKTLMTKIDKYQKLVNHSEDIETLIEMADEEEDEEQQTIYLNEVEEEWDLNKYKGIGWDE